MNVLDKIDRRLLKLYYGHSSLALYHFSLFLGEILTICRLGRGDETQHILGLLGLAFALPNLRSLSLFLKNGITWITNFRGGYH
jgi:hypothetical protein